jgi:hypothetical protein
MAGTTPYTFTALELLTAAKMNAIQDNMAITLDAINEPVILAISLNDDVDLSSGNGQKYFHIPARMNGWTITGATASRLSGSGTVSIQVHNVTDAVDVFSSNLSMAGTYSSTVTINTSNDDVATGDIFRVDVDDDGTSTLHCSINIEFTRP